MADGGKTIAMVGILGVGGYVAYEYFRYSNALSIISQHDPTGATANAIGQALGFMGFLTAGFSPPAAGTPASQAYQLLTAAAAGTLGQVTPTPGTTAAGPATTSVTTAPGTTPAPPPLPSSAPQPTAADLQNALNATTASADQWNYAYRQLTGYGIEQIYGGDFGAIYGAVGSDGTRPTGNISAQAFLNLPSAKGLSATGLHGFGAIARFYTPVINSMGSMVYRAQHPSPYRAPMGGSLGALTQATGFEKALWAGGFLRNARIR